MSRKKYKQKNKKLTLILMIMFLILNTGCWDRRELDNRAIVSGMALDSTKKGREVLVSAQIIDPSKAKGPQSDGGGGGGKPFIMVDSQAATVFDAIRNMTHSSSRKLFFPNSQVIIYGEDLARDGIKDYFDMFTRDYEIRETNWILVSEGKAADVLSTQTEISSISGFYIADLINERGSSSQAVAVNTAELSRMIQSKSTAPVTSYIRTKKQGNKTRFFLTGTAVFNHDLKMTGKLNEEETRGLLWVLGKVESGIIVVESPRGEGNYSLEILKSSGQIVPDFKDGKPVITVKIKADSNLGESSRPEDLMKPGPWKTMEKLQNNIIRQEVNMALRKAQELNADVFGFGEAFHKKYPRQWREMEALWDEIFPSLEVRVVVESTVRRPGLTISNVFTAKGD